jgi:hypothetical protein
MHGKIATEGETLSEPVHTEARKLSECQRRSTCKPAAYATTNEKIVKEGGRAKMRNPYQEEATTRSAAGSQTKAIIKRQGNSEANENPVLNWSAASVSAIATAEADRPADGACHLAR